VMGLGMVSFWAPVLWAVWPMVSGTRRATSDDPSIVASAE